MGLGIYKRLNKVYITYIVLKFQIRKFLFGFENANKLFLTMDKRAAIPILRKNGAVIGENCDIETPLIFHNCYNYKNLSIGKNCHIGKGCFLDLKNCIDIGNNVTVSMQCTLLTHLDLGKSKLIDLYPPENKKTIIEDNVYIGANSTILMGIELKEGSFIAAGSIVTKNVEPNTLVGGVPAKVIKRL